MIINCSSIFYCQNRGIELGYRFSFNGMEKDDEVKGVGNSYTTLYRINDARLGRWLSVDPKADVTPGESPYSSMANNPILNTDPDGDCIPCLLFLLVVASNVLDSDFAEAPGTDPSAKAKKQSEKSHKELANVNSGVQIISNPTNLTKAGGKVVIGKVVSNQIKAKAKQNQTKPASQSSKRNPRKLAPDKSAEDHTSFERDKDGNIYKYETYKKTKNDNHDPRKRYDGGTFDGKQGAPHNDKSGTPIETPTISGKDVPEGARKPTPQETPNNPRFKKDE